MTDGGRRAVVVAVVGLRMSSLDVEEEVFSGLDVRLVRSPGASADEIIAAARDAEAILAGSMPRFPAEVIEALPHLRAIVRYGIGVDSIDVRAAAERGVQVANVPDYCIPEVATHTVVLILAAARRLLPGMQAAREGRWDVGAVRPLPECEAQTVGLVGLGRIGHGVASRLRPFGFRLLAADPIATAEAARAAGAELVPLEDLLGAADIVTLHLPLTAATRHLISREALARMRPGAWLVNTARGGLVDEGALLEALEAGRLAGAALDVLAQEPPAADHPLLRHPRVLVTPHVAWYSERAVVEMRRKAAEEVRRLLRGEPLLHPVSPEGA